MGAVGISGSETPEAQVIWKTRKGSLLKVGIMGSDPRVQSSNTDVSALVKREPQYSTFGSHEANTIGRSLLCNEDMEGQPNHVGGVAGAGDNINDAHEMTVEDASYSHDVKNLTSITRRTARADKNLPSANNGALFGPGGLLSVRHVPALLVMITILAVRS